MVRAITPFSMFRSNAAPKKIPLNLIHLKKKDVRAFMRCRRDFLLEELAISVSYTASTRSQMGAVTGVAMRQCGLLRSPSYFQTENSNASPNIPVLK